MVENADLDLQDPFDSLDKALKLNFFLNHDLDHGLKLDNN
jgi:hypothetical protein